MDDDLQKSAAHKAKELLKLDGEPSVFELVALLREFRKESHPDKFTDHELKEKAQSRFLEVQSILVALEKQLAIERFNHKPSELALYKPLYDAAHLQSELDNLERKLQETKSELKTARQENISLEESLGNLRESNTSLAKQLQTKKDDSLNKEIQYLQSLYRPSSGGYASLGLAIVLSGALGIMAKMEQISSVLERYSPFGKQIISNGLFMCLVAFLSALIKKVWESDYIRRKSEEICSPKCAYDFLQYLKAHCASAQRDYDAPILEFSEVEVFSFISGRNSGWKSILALLGFRIFTQETVNRLKDIFVHNMLNKKLVEVSRAEGMQRYFMIAASKPQHIIWQQYLSEREEKRAKKEAATAIETKGDSESATDTASASNPATGP